MAPVPLESPDPAPGDAELGGDPLSSPGRYPGERHPWGAPPQIPRGQLAPDGAAWLAPYQERAALAPMRETTPFLDTELSELPIGFVPWWYEPLQHPLRLSSEQLPVNVDLLVLAALEFAPQIRAVQLDPRIRYSTFLEEQAAFDWKVFVETRWDDINDPVGSTLTTGTNASRFKDRIWSSKAGLRQTNSLGGKFEISQKYGWEEQNSRFFVPNPQGTSRLQLNYTQPLLNGAGEAYNTSRIVLAGIETNMAQDRALAELQDHLLAVTNAYWDLYRARALFLQRQKLLLSAIEIERTVAGRQAIDALERQVLRARAAVAGRRAAILRAAADVRNAESRLRLLVNDPGLIDVGTLELVAEEPPLSQHVPLSMSGSLQTALIHRPDISQAIRLLRAASVRAGVAENELLPRLDLVLSTYVAGLRGGGDFPASTKSQFSEGRPTYAAGLLFEVPLGNRAAEARYSRRQLEYSRAVYDFRTTVETALTEVELAVRDADTAHREMLSRYLAMEAANEEALYLDARWRLIPGGDRSTTLLLEDLLDSQQRLADIEAEFVAAQVNYVTALARVRQVTGTLLEFDQDLAVAPVDAAPAVAPERLEEPTELRPVPISHEVPGAVTLPGRRSPRDAGSVSGEANFDPVGEPAHIAAPPPRTTSSASIEPLGTVRRVSGQRSPGGAASTDAAIQPAPSSQPRPPETAPAARDSSTRLRLFR